MFNWVPPTPTLAFILISVEEEQENTFWEQCYIEKGSAKKKKENKIRLENLLKGAWE